MEPELQQAPPVVAVVVVHEPGDWFDETLEALADQDYPNLRFLFLGTDLDGDVQDRIRGWLPNAFIRSTGADVGFGETANEVLRLVDGDKGFFLLCHDDVAPDPGSVRTLVEEIYRSNAGVVGPKFVEWDDAAILQSVGLGLDRFGEVDLAIEPGEVDQEQHDGVRDVFAVPSAFMLVRADLFRQIDGFDPAISFHGEDVELCWRIHHSGARVVVAPSARVRHRARLEERRPDLNHPLMQARNRMRTVATLTGPTRLPGRSLEMVLLTTFELVVGIFTGRLSEAWTSMRALIGLVPRTPSSIIRRRAVKALRLVPEGEVLDLQVRGSARLSAFLRARDTSTYVGTENSVRRWRESTTAPVIAWILVLAAVLIGSRQFITGGVPAVGEFLRFPESPRDLLASFMSGWNPAEGGSTSANPTGWATLSGLSVFTLFRMGALHTWFIVGLVVIGLIGLWKLATVFPSTRGRIAALVVYAASPLVVGAMSTGRLTVLIAYASTPWIIHTIRSAVGVETADPRAAETDLPDGLVELAIGERVQRIAKAAIVVALAAAFAPIMLPIALLIAVVLAAATLLALAPARTALLYLVTGIGAVFGGLLLNLPWATTWSWDQLVGSPPIGDPGRGLTDLASFRIGTFDFALLTLALYLPVIAAVALARAWRLTWAIRSGGLVVVFGALAVFADRDALPFRGPEAGVLLAPVAVGLAVSAAAALASFDLDVRGGSFGWKQPLGLLASASIVVGVLPALLAIGDGGWNTPRTPLVRLLEAQLPADANDRTVPDPADENGTIVEPGRGDYRVLLIGDARLLPVPSIEYRDGVSFALIDDGPLDVRDRWAAPDTGADATIRQALDEMARSSTLRAGRLLAPLGVRFIVAPEFDNVVSTTTDPLPLPIGLLEALEDQLDLSSVTGLPTLEVFENTAWLPMVGQLTAGTAEASGNAGAESLVGADLSSVSPVFLGLDHLSTGTAEVEPGVVHLAVPFDDNWKLTVGDTEIPARRAFGVTTAFDVEQGGVATLSYSTSSGRLLSVGLQLVLWLVALVAANRVGLPVRRGRGALVADETLIDFSVDHEALDVDQDAGRDEVVSPLMDPGIDITGQIARARLDDELTPQWADDSPDAGDEELDRTEDDDAPIDAHGDDAPGDDQPGDDEETR